VLFRFFSEHLSECHKTFVTTYDLTIFPQKLVHVDFLFVSMSRSKVSTPNVIKECVVLEKAQSQSLWLGRVAYLELTMDQNKKV
jgi:hypothetical protein